MGVDQISNQPSTVHRKRKSILAGKLCHATLGELRAFGDSRVGQSELLYNCEDFYQIYSDGMVCDIEKESRNIV